MKRLALLVLVVGLVAADAPKDDAAKKELEKLQGNWKSASIREGKEEKSKDAVTTITGDKFVTKVGDKIERAGTIKVDPTQTPKTIDATYTEGPDKGKTLLGIYSQNDDNWTICYGEPGKVRPTEFPDKGAAAYLLLILKKEKK